MFARGYIVGILSGVGCCCTAYRVHCKRFEGQDNPHIEYQEQPVQKDKVSRSASILKYGVPQRSADISIYRNHVLCYNQERRIPHWVAEHITRQSLQGEANRRHSNFKPDPGVVEMFSAQNQDYLGSGWSRGHMAPAGNCKADQDAMNDTFLLTNIVPQDMDNNAGFWNRFEIFCRDLTQKYAEVRVISGPLFVPVSDEQQPGRKHVKYQVIGNSDVAVPTHLYKVVVAETSSSTDKKLVGAFVVPNCPIGRDKELRQYQVPLEYVESRAGLRMLPALERGSMRDLCSVDSCRLIPWDKFELYFIGRKIESANTLHRLDKVWKEVELKKLKPDNDLITAYQNKRKELEKLDASRSKA